MLNNRQIVCEKRRWQENLQVHTHPFGQLLFALQGELFMETETRVSTIDRHNLIYLPPDCKHRFSAKTGWTEGLVVDIPLELVCDPAQPDIVCYVNQDWAALRMLLLSETSRKYPAYSPLLVYTFHLLMEHRQPPSMCFIREHFNEPVTLKMLAEIEGYNPTYYCHWFKQRVGLTPQQYIRQLRIEKAKQLLLESDYALGTISDMTGFKHQSHLTKLFKQIERISPLTYRIQNRYKKS